MDVSFTEMYIFTGMWYEILQFLNVLGVVSNACLIAFTSYWGSKYDTVGKLLIVIGFEVSSKFKVS